MHRAIHCLIHGRVQGVYFRASARERARELGVTGWARNLPDGRVEIWAVGSGDAIEAFRAWLDRGPPAARVDQVDAGEQSVDECPSDFEVR